MNKRNNDRNRGYIFEEFVEDLFNKLGYRNVKRNNIYNVRRFFRKRKVQIDIEYSRFFGRRYIECKYRENSNVGKQEVEKFIRSLRLLGASGRGMLITNTYFTNSAKRISRRYHLKLCDRDCLYGLYKKTIPFVRRISYNKNIENIILGGV